MNSRLVAVTLVALSGCASSPPMHFYTLTALAPTSTPASGSSLVRLADVRIPDELDRPQLVRRVDATRLDIAEQDRWAAPLDELVRRTLWTDLSLRLPGAMINPLESSDPKARKLALSIDEFIADASCKVTLRATWTLSDPVSVAKRGTESIEEPTPGACTIGVVPEVMSRALATLSDRLADAAR